MSYIEAIKEGFRVVHKNWQLVLIQFAMVLINFIGFFIIVGIPLAIAFIIFGIDLTGLSDIKDILRTLKGPSEIITRYFGLLLIVILSFLFYIIAAALFGMYVFGGSAGIIGKTIGDQTLRFSMHTFFHEAKRLFTKILSFTAVIGVILILAAFVLGILGGSIAALISFARGLDSTLALFFVTFLSLILIIIAFTLIFGTLSVTLYGIAVLFFKGIGPIKSLREAIHYLVRHPYAFWLYTILLGGYVLASFILILLSYSFHLIPVIGTILSFPYQLISYVFQTYLGLAIIAITFTYYYATEIQTEPMIESSLPKASTQDETITHDT